MEELDPVFNRVAAYFGLLSEPMRLKIVHAICLKEKSVSEIVQVTGATQTSVSRHLNRMHAAGAVARRREGNQVYYRVADANLVDLCRNVCLRIAAEIDDQQPMRKGLMRLIPPAPKSPARRLRSGAAARRTGGDG